MADYPTLDEISQMPEGPDELAQHLYANGFATPPQPPPPPAPVFPDMTVSTPLTPPDRYAGARNQNFSMPVSGEDLGGAPELGAGEPSGAGRLDFKPLGPVKPVEPTRSVMNVLGGGNYGPVQPPEAPWDLSPSASSAPTPRAAAPVAGKEMVPPEIGAMGAAPAAGAPPAGGAIPTPAPPLTLTKPTRQESREAGKEERELNIAQYQRERPQITAPYNTQEYWGQIAAQKDFDLRHPLGAPISRMPGTKGKILHGLGMAGEIAGQMTVPGIMPMVPGTRQNLALGEGTALREGSRVGKEKLETEKGASEMAEQAARTANIEQQTKKAGAEELLQIGPNGEVNGWKDGMGVYHALSDPKTPQAIREIASTTEGKLIKPTVEKMDNGDVLGITPGYPAIPGLPATEDHPATEGTPAVPPSVQLLYHGDPKLETDLTSRTVNGKEHHILVNKKTGEDIKDLGAFKAETTAAQSLAQMKHDETEMIAYDPNHNSYIAPYGQINELGLMHPGKASPADRKNAEDATSGLNEVGRKTLVMDKTLKALDQNPAQRAIIAYALSHAGVSDTLDQLMKSAAMHGASPDTEKFVIAANNLREAVLALPKIVTGTSRMTDVQAQALWKTIVDGSARGSKYGHNQLLALDEQVARQWRKVPLVEGNPVSMPSLKCTKGQPRSFEEGVQQRAAGGAAAPAAGGPPGPPEPGMKWQQTARQAHIGKYRRINKWLTTTMTGAM
jgi:hypothetical protein